MPSGHRLALTEAAAETSQQKQSTGLFLLPFLRLLTLKDLGALPQTPQLLKKLAKLLLVSPKPERGPLVSRSQQAPPLLAAFAS